MKYTNGIFNKIKKHKYRSLICLLFLATIILTINSTSHLSNLITIIILSCLNYFIFENLLKEKEKAEIILKKLPFLIMLKNSDGKIIHANRNIKNFYNDKYIIKYAKNILEEDLDITTNKKSLSTIREIETKTNSIIRYKVTKSPILDKWGKVSKIFLFSQNIEDELITNERKNTFIATMVHDLKNPVLAQIRMLELLIKKENNNSALTDIHIQMLSTAKNQFEIISSILNSYKYENGEISYNFEQQNILELVTEICNEQTYLTNNANEISILNENTNNNIFADKLHIRRVITNLVSNAIHYRKENSPIEITLKNFENNIIFEVTNFGHHIKPEVQEQLFKKYVSKSKKYNNIGTGLGLYIAKKIITAHNGQMIVKSNINGRNSFGFIIPAMQQPQVLESLTQN